MEIHNPLNSAEIWAQTRKPQDKQDSKIAYSVNGSWLTRFLLLRKKVLFLFNLMERSLTGCCKLSLYKFWLPGIWNLFDLVSRYI